MILLADLVLIALAVPGAYRVAIRPALPVDYATESGRVVILAVPDPAVGFNLQPQDLIISIDAQAVAFSADVEFLTDHKKIGDLVELKIKRDEATFSATVPLEKFYSARYLAVQSLAAALYFFLAILVLVKRPGDSVARSFHWLSMATAVMIMSTWASYDIGPKGFGHAIQLLDLAANAAVPVLFMGFSFVFPRRNDWALKKLLPLTQGLAVVLLAWMMITFLSAALPPSVTAYHRFLVAFDALRWYFSLALIIGLGSFVLAYSRSKDGSERRQIRWVLMGLGISIAGFILLWRIPYVVLRQPLISAEMVVLLSTAAPIAFAIAIVRYRLMDIDLIFFRSTVYFIVISFLLAIYSVIIGAVALLSEELTIPVVLIASALAATVVAVLFEPTRQRIRRFVDRSFFKIRYDYEVAQRELGEEISQCATIPQLGELVIRRLRGLMLLEQVGLIMRPAPDEPFEVVFQHDGELFREPQLFSFLEQQPATQRLPLAPDDQSEPGARYAPADPDHFRKLGLALLNPISSEGNEIMGYLALGPKMDGTRFYVEDFDLLNTIGTQLGQAAERIRLHERLVLEHAETTRLKELNRLKSDFVSSVSHELQTPLTSIKMFAELLREKSKAGSGKTREYLDVIVGESDRLTARIQNVLDFARVERGVREYNFQTVDLDQLVSKVIESMRYQLNMQEFKVQADLRLKDKVLMADADAVSEALTNLITNAIKYSRDVKEITIATFERDGRLGVSVADEGIGIDESDRKAIFEPFYRSAKDGIRRGSGTGLGLPLVSHTMAAHRGSIELESEPGAGSTFTLLFPMEQKD